MVEVATFALVVITKVAGGGAHQDVGMNSMLSCSTGAAALSNDDVGLSDLTVVLHAGHSRDIRVWHVLVLADTVDTSLVHP